MHSSRLSRMPPGLQMAPPTVCLAPSSSATLPTRKWWQSGLPSTTGRLPQRSLHVISPLSTLSPSLIPPHTLSIPIPQLPSGTGSLSPSDSKTTLPISQHALFSSSPVTLPTHPQAPLNPGTTTRVKTTKSSSKTLLLPDLGDSPSPHRVRLFFSISFSLVHLLFSLFCSCHHSYHNHGCQSTTPLGPLLSQETQSQKLCRPRCSISPCSCSSSPRRPSSQQRQRDFAYPASCQHLPFPMFVFFPLSIFFDSLSLQLSISQPQKSELHPIQSLFSPFPPPLPRLPLLPAQVQNQHPTSTHFRWALPLPSQSYQNMPLHQSRPSIIVLLSPSLGQVLRRQRVQSKSRRCCKASERRARVHQSGVAGQVLLRGLRHPLHPAGAGKSIIRLRRLW